MALERQSIEKKDFPIGRRGYDPDAVDSHLASIAAEVEELKKTSRRRSETLATSASEQVRAIVEAAENSAAEIQRQAEDEAGEIRAEATAEAKAAREQATDQARQYVGRVSESTAVMLQRLDAMESELAALIESLRTGSNRLNADLQLLEGNLTEVSEAVSPRPRFEREPNLDIAEAGAVGLESELEVELEEVVIDEYVVEELEAEVEAELEADAELEAALEPISAADADDGADDTEGARLIALNMALNGTPREETDRYLAENFELSDRAGLLDEVYASVEG
ncbi:MAG TPA: DivIVA domain-containing protein [Solirubrobacteraceae bacterium]|nr:DivIVA domain-containing protein [Solirubrobacteraceae bacterium]